MILFPWWMFLNFHFSYTGAYFVGVAVMYVACAAFYRYSSIGEIEPLPGQVGEVPTSAYIVKAMCLGVIWPLVVSIVVTAALLLAAVAIGELAWMILSGLFRPARTQLPNTHAVSATIKKGWE